MAKLLFILALLPPASGLAGDQDVLSEVAFFNRCYADLTMKRVPFSHPLLAAVKAGTMRASDACKSILDSAALAPPGSSTEGKLVSDTPDGRAVLKTFNNVHRLWFPSDLLSATLYDSGNSSPKTYWIHDEGEAALAVTRAAFGGAPYTDVLTLDSGVEALRTSGATTISVDTNATPGVVANQFGGGATPATKSMSFEGVQTGELLGVRPMSKNPNKINVVGYAGFGWDNMPIKDPIYFNRSLGGGVIGTKSYIILNIGPPVLPDGGLHQLRRWSKMVMHDLLCRDMPAMRPTDAARFVQTTITANTPSFRKSSTCVSCHATMDPMAGAVRNAITVVTPTGSYSGEDTAHPYIWSVTQPAETGTIDLDPKFYLRPPNGAVNFRGYDGTWYEKPVTGAADLGAYLATTNDFYVCAAARYYRYFTGVGVDLHDVGDTSRPPLPVDEQIYRDEVVNLGLNFKANPDVRILIKAILDSPIYRSQSRRHPR